MPGNQKSNKLLAIDPGTREMGFACFEHNELVDYGVKAIRQGRTTRELFLNIERVVVRLIEEKHPILVLIEKNNFSQITQNARLTIAITKIKLISKKSGVPVIEYNPRTVRKVVCNNGNATKRELAKTVATVYPEMRAYLESNRRWRERYYQNSFDAIACGMTFLRRDHYRK